MAEDLARTAFISNLWNEARCWKREREGLIAHFNLIRLSKEEREGSQWYCHSHSIFHVRILHSSWMGGKKSPQRESEKTCFDYVNESFSIYFPSCVQERELFGSHTWLSFFFHGLLCFLVQRNTVCHDETSFLFSLALFSCSVATFWHGNHRRRERKCVHLKIVGGRRRNPFLVTARHKNTLRNCAVCRNCLNFTRLWKCSARNQCMQLWEICGLIQELFLFQ